jgi:hypothetical protein
MRVNGAEGEMGELVALFWVLIVVPPLAVVVFMILIKHVKRPHEAERVDRNPAFPVVTEKIKDQAE